ncbi:MAG: HipA family kinase, partial [Thermomicrobiales bacterium]
MQELQVNMSQSSPYVRTVSGTRYVSPLREGGSLPGIVEADDDGLYVVKFRGAGQGLKTLVAELICGELGRLLGLHVPELVVIDVPLEFAQGERDDEVRDLLTKSVGSNLGLDFLPGALPFDVARNGTISAELAADIVWFDALIANVDRTVRNPNMLLWHRNVWLIDHGAALYQHHRWADPRKQGRQSFPPVKDHVLLPQAGSIIEADARMAGQLDETKLWSVISSVPDDWLPDDDRTGDADRQRVAYHDYLISRLEYPRPFMQEAEERRTDVNVGEIDPDRATRGRRRE